MKTMTCNQLGGACDMEFSANSFEEISAMSKNHAMEMFQNGDEAHLQAMNKMKELMKSPDAVQKWFQEKQNLFESLPDN